jgi:hypothetical protein
MLPTIKSTFRESPASILACIGRCPLGSRTLQVWLGLVFAKLKELAPYAAIELVLPGGSVVALTLWFYRRRRKVLG